MDPLGDLFISDGQFEIVIKETYLDSWFAGFVRAIAPLGAGHHASVQTEERHPIKIDFVAGGHLAISYEGQTVIATGLTRFEVALRAAINSFLAVLNRYPDSWRNRDIDPIRAFWATPPN